MQCAQYFLELDFLVFSSHKSGTQTLRNSLRASGYKAAHCHNVRHLGLRHDEFESYLNQYSQQRGKKLDLITVFREPIDRHISSFFQGHGSRPLAKKLVADKTETLIYQMKPCDLCDLFISELESESLIGFSESIHEIATELRFNPSDLLFDNQRGFSVFETSNVRVFLFRFDSLFSNFSALMGEITDRSFIVQSSNMSERKWYRETYLAFRNQLAIPSSIIEKTYKKKEDLIKLFYSGSFETPLRNAIAMYGI